MGPAPQPPKSGEGKKNMEIEVYCVEYNEIVETEIDPEGFLLDDSQRKEILAMREGTDLPPFTAEEIDEINWALEEWAFSEDCPEMAAIRLDRALARIAYP